MTVVIIIAVCLAAIAGLWVVMRDGLAPGKSTTEPSTILSPTVTEYMEISAPDLARITAPFPEAEGHMPDLSHVKAPYPQPKDYIPDTSHVRAPSQ